MRKVFLLVVTILFSISLFSQHLSTKDFIKIEKTINIEELKYNMEKHNDYSAFSDLISYYYNDTLFFLRADLSTPETIRMYAFSIETNTYSYQDFDASALISGFDGIAYNIEKFTINRDYLVIPCYNNGNFLFVYKRISKEYVYDFRVQYDSSKFSEDIKFLPNGKLLGLKNYVSYTRADGEKPEESSSLSILNLETKEIEKTINLEFLLPLYTLRSPYNILSVNDSSILFAQRGDYKIEEYDFDLNKISTIENKEIKWDRMPQNASDSLYRYTKFAGEKFPYLNANIDKYSCIHNIYSSNDKLFVFYSKKGSFNKLYYDIWTKESGNWILLKKDISDITKSIRHLNERSLTAMSANNIYFLGDKFIRLGFNLPDLGRYPRFIYKIKAQNYMTEKERPCAIEIISFNLK